MDQTGVIRLLGQAADLPRAVRKLGLGATIGLVRSHLAEHRARILGPPRAGGNPLRAVRPKGCEAPIHYRINTTDINVLQQVFLSGEYDCVGSEPNPELIVDCGSNIGCASVYFLNRYPRARVISVEADLGNFDVGRLNLAPYGSRVEAIHGAIWPRFEALTVERNEPGKTQEWSFFIRPCREGEPKEVDGVSLADLVEQAPGRRIDLLKIDIEGGERELFSSGFEPWLSRTKTLVIELHGPDCRAAFLRAVGLYPFRVEDFGPVTVARRDDLAAPG